MSEELDLNTPVEIAPGKFKPLGICTGDDLDGAQAVAQEKAEVYGEVVALLRGLSDHIGPEGRIALPEDVLAQLQDDPAERNLPALQALRDELRGLSALDDPKGHG